LNVDYFLQIFSSSLSLILVFTTLYIGLKGITSSKAIVFSGKWLAGYLLLALLLPWSYRFFSDHQNHTGATKLIFFVFLLFVGQLARLLKQNLIIWDAGKDVMEDGLKKTFGDLNLTYKLGLGGLETGDGGAFKVMISPRWILLSPQNQQANLKFKEVSRRLKDFFHTTPLPQKPYRYWVLVGFSAWGVIYSIKWFLKLFFDHAS